MKIFIYKALIVTLLFYVLFEFTIGRQISRFDTAVQYLKSHEGRDEILVKIKKEIKKGNQKETYLDDEERELIITFINKIKKELALEDNK